MRTGANARGDVQQKRPHPGKGEADQPSRGRLSQFGEEVPLPDMLPGSPQGDTDLSIRVMDLVWKRFPGSGSELLVLLACADWGNDQGGRIYPSVKALATKIRVTEGQARRVLHGLIDGGWVHVVGNANGGRPGMTRQYQIDMAKLAAAPVIGGVTTGADETPGDDATPGAGARDGLHGRQGGVALVHETGSADASLTVKRTVKEPLKNPPTPRKRGDGVQKGMEFFDEFWAKYPRKVAKGEAEKAWPGAVKANGGDAEGIYLGLAMRLHVPELFDPREGGRFIPHPATWLRRKGWEDAIPGVDPNDPFWKE